MANRNFPEEPENDAIGRMLRDTVPEIHSHRIDMLTQRVLSSIPETSWYPIPGWQVSAQTTRLLYGSIFLLGCLAPLLGHAFNDLSPLDWAFSPIWTSPY